MELDNTFFTIFPKSAKVERGPPKQRQAKETWKTWKRILEKEIHSICLKAKSENGRFQGSQMVFRDSSHPFNVNKSLLSTRGDPPKKMNYLLEAGPF